MKEIIRILWSAVIKLLVGSDRYSRNGAIQSARKQGVRVGENCRIYQCSFGSEPYLVELGNHVSITKDVHFITHDGGVWIFRELVPDADIFGRIKVGNNVFIGLGTIIMPGVIIGDNVVIGAGSVVTNSIPSNTVAAGNPARVIRDSEEYRNMVDNLNAKTKGLSREQKRKKLESGVPWIEKKYASLD